MAADPAATVAAATGPQQDGAALAAVSPPESEQTAAGAGSPEVLSEHLTSDEDRSAPYTQC